LSIACKAGVACFDEVWVGSAGQMDPEEGTPRVSQACSAGGNAADPVKPSTGLSAGYNPVA